MNIEHRMSYEHGFKDGFETACAAISILIILAAIVGFVVLEHNVQHNWKNFEQKYYEQSIE